MSGVVKKGNVKLYVLDEPKLELLLKDDMLEEVMVNGPGKPVYVYHRIHGMCPTNLVLTTEQIMEIIDNVAKASGEVIDEERPFLDARLPDGSRFNATIPPATPFGPTITIRKFWEKPLSIVDLIENGTLSIEAAAFLWTCVEGERNYPLNILVIGGAGSGKTTTLNVISTFIPKDERIIVIEDTLELNLGGRENVVRMESTPRRRDKPPITMNDLLINALRMRPDRLIVGEVRGPEAETLFNAMNIGHSAMGTLHANSPREIIARLTNPPMNVPMNMLPLVDIVVLMKKVRAPEGLKRRVGSICEVERSEVGVSFAEIFSYDPRNDKVYRTDTPSHKLEEIATFSGKDISQVKRHLEEKRILLESLIHEGIKDFKAVFDHIQGYYEQSDSPSL